MEKTFFHSSKQQDPPKSTNQNRSNQQRVATTIFYMQCTTESIQPLIYTVQKNAIYRTKSSSAIGNHEVASQKGATCRNSSISHALGKTEQPLCTVQKAIRKTKRKAATSPTINKNHKVASQQCAARDNANISRAVHHRTKIQPLEYASQQNTLHNSSSKTQHESYNTRYNKPTKNTQ